MKYTLLTILLTASLLFGQNNDIFENISIPQGLSNPSVGGIYQDSRGFLWVATQDGLNRYDGYEIKVYKNDPGDPSSLPVNDTGAIVEDDEGYLWIGCFGSVIARYDPADDSFKRYEIDRAGVSDLSNSSTAIKDHKGNIWFGTSNNGVQKYDRKNDKFQFIPLDSTETNTNWGEVNWITQLKNGNILAADYGSGIKIYNEGRNSFQTYYLKVNYSPTEVATIQEMPSGDIYFGANNKLIKYSPVYYTVEEVDVFSGLANRNNYDVVNSMFGDDEGNLWFSVYSKGFFKLDTKSGTFIHFNQDRSLPNGIHSNIVVESLRDRFGIIWLGHQTNGLDKFDPLREPFQFYKMKPISEGNNQANAITCIAGSPLKNRITLGTSTHGIYEFDLQTREYSRLNISRAAINQTDDNHNIFGLVDDNTGGLWFITDQSGIYHRDKMGKINYYASPYAGRTTTFSLFDMKMDLSGRIWMGSRYGVTIFDPSSKEFTNLPRIMDRIPEPELMSRVREIAARKNPLAALLKAGEAANAEKRFTIDAEKYVLVISLGEGRIVQGNDGTFDYGTLRDQKSNVIWIMKNMARTYHAGGGFKNRLAMDVLKLEQGEYRINYVSDVGHSYGNWNTLAPQDSNWWGIQVLEIDQQEYNVLNDLLTQSHAKQNYMDFEIARYIEFSKRYYNVIWIGTVSNSFFRYDKSTGEFKKYNFNQMNQFSAENSINTILEDRDGIVWIGTQANLLRLDPETEKIDKFNTNNGLPGNLISALIEDLQGNLWISTPGGFSKLNKNAPREKWNFVNFDSRDGMQGYSSAESAWLSSEGEVFLGGNDGLNSFFPGKINTIAPSIVIDDIRINDISVRSDSSLVSESRNVYTMDHLDLAYAQNDISFNIATIHFSGPAKNRMSYKLEGFNAGWVDTEHNYITFTNLDPGEYTFMVRGANSDGIWNEQGRKISITIAPPWWQTKMAYAGYVFGFVLIVFGVDRIQRRRIMSRERSAAAIREAELRAQLAESENERKSKELEEARQLQLSMLPRELPALPHLDIAVYMKTATEVGGDYYDFHVGLDGTLTVVIGDATGHGMKAGTMVTTAKSLFSSYAPNPDILFSFHEITRCIKQMNLGKLSMCLTMLKIGGNKVSISAAGMPPVFIFRRDKQIIEEHLLEGMPLGTMNKFPYEVVETTLSPGDTILMISDGLPELQNTDQVLFGYNRVRNAFEEVAQQSPDEIVSYLKNAGSEWVDNRDPDDDVTFVVLRMK